MFDSLDVPVFDRADIVVAGGGPAGIAASLAATRLGKSVILLEQTGSAGGMSTNALVPAIISRWDGVRTLCGNLCDSIVDECTREMGLPQSNPGWQEVDAEILRRIYDRRLVDAGVKLYYMMRAADVVLKERRRLVLVPRECPLSTLHLRNLTAASELGAVIVPPVPAYYQHPKCIEDINGRISAKVLALFGLDTGAIPEWGGLDL